MSIAHFSLSVATVCIDRVDRVDLKKQLFQLRLQYPSPRFTARFLGPLEKPSAFRSQRRLSPEVRDVFEEQYDQLSLRCRTKLDVCDAEEIARMVVRKNDHELSRKLLKRLSQSEDLCKSSALSEIPWLLVDMEGQTGLVEPRSAWHQDVKDVLGLVRPIAEGPKSTLKLLQVKLEEDLDDNVLKEQHLG